MQVQPIAAIRPIKIRQKPIAEAPSINERDSHTQPQFVPTNRDAQTPQETTPADFSPVGYSAYTAQLLITHHATAETNLDRATQIARYAAGGQAAPMAPMVSMSV